MATFSEDDLELSLAKIAIVALILLWLVLPFLISELQALEVRASLPETSSSKAAGLQELLQGPGPRGLTVEPADPTLPLAAPCSAWIEGP